MYKKKKKFYKEKWFKIILIVSIVIIIGIFVNNSMGNNKTDNGIVYISVGTPQISNLKQTVDVRGKVESSKTRSVYPDTEVRVKDDLVKSGYYVKKGTPIIECIALSEGKSYTYRAPIDGVVTEIAGTDQTVDKSAVLVKISGDNELLVTANVPQRDSYKIKPGQNVEIKVDANDISAKGKVKEIASYAKEIDGNRGKINAVEVCISFINKDKLFKIGYDVNASILITETEDSLSVPKTALLTDGDKQYLYVINGNDVAHKVYVETGIDNGSDIEIKSGIDKNSRVIFLVSNEVKDGFKIDPKSIKIV